MKHTNVIEALTQVVAGTVFIFISNVFVFHLLGIEASYNVQASLVAINTVIAFIKSYAVRAFFKKIEEKSNANG